VVGVSDGDTITLLDEGKAQRKVRINGIDAPEKGQADLGSAFPPPPLRAVTAKPYGYEPSGLAMHRNLTRKLT